MDLHIDRTGKDNLHLQIRKQIEYLISAGVLRAGDRLPTLRELEQQLGVNRHTVRRAYLDLEGQGLLSVRQGRGVTVTAMAAEGMRGPHNTDVDDLVARTFGEAGKLGYDPVAFARVLERAAVAADRRSPSIAFVECTQHQAGDLARVLEAQLGRAVIPVNLEDLESGPGALSPGVRHLVAPAFHAHEAAQLVDSTRVSTVTAQVVVGHRFIAQARNLLPAERPGIILRDREAHPLYPGIVRELLGLDGELALAWKDDRRAVGKLVMESDLVFYTPVCQDIAAQLVPEEKKQQEVLFEFTPDALELIRRSIEP